METVREGIRLRREARATILPWGALARIATESSPVMTMVDGSRAHVEGTHLVVSIKGVRDAIKLPLSAVREAVEGRVIGARRIGI
jgi:hypothetical protein